MEIVSGELTPGDSIQSPLWKPESSFLHLVQAFLAFFNVPLCSVPCLNTSYSRMSFVFINIILRGQ